MTLKSILVTGAAGFVGRHLVDRLRVEWPDCELILADRNAGTVGGIPVIPIDVSNEDQMVDLVRTSRPDAAIHLAAVSAISNAVAHRKKTWEINAMAPYYLAMAIIDHAPDCHLLFVSSAEVYGKSAEPGVKLTETTLLRPANPYASAKAAADLLVQELAGSQLSATVMRPFNHIGPLQSLAFAVPSFCSQIVAIERGAEPVIRVGMLEDVRDFLHVRDVVDAYVRALAQRASYPSGTVFNVASGMAVCMKDVLAGLIGLSSVEVRLEIDETKLRGRAPTSVVGDASRLRSTLDWAPSRQLTDILSETLDYWRETLP